MAVEFDEFERGYPPLTLSVLLDVVIGLVHNADDHEILPCKEALKANDAATLKAKIAQLKKIDSPVSCGALLGKLARLNRLNVYFPHMARPLLVSADPPPAKLRLID